MDIVYDREAHPACEVLKGKTKEHRFSWRFVCARDTIVVSPCETVARVYGKYLVILPEDTPTSIWPLDMLLFRPKHWDCMGGIPPRATHLAIFPPRESLCDLERLLLERPPVGGSEPYSRVMPVEVQRRPLAEEEKQFSPEAQAERRDIAIARKARRDQARAASAGGSARRLMSDEEITNVLKAWKRLLPTLGITAAVTKALDPLCTKGHPELVLKYSNTETVFRRLKAMSAPETPTIMWQNLVT